MTYLPIRNPASGGNGARFTSAIGEAIDEGVEIAKINAWTHHADNIRRNDSELFRKSTFQLKILDLP